jgi:hypothetical protein
VLAANPLASDIPTIHVNPFANLRDIAAAGQMNKL